jgi:hypothetical protein
VAKGTSIWLFLVDDSPSGIVAAGVDGWTGQALVIPRAKMDEFAARDEAKRAAVYILVGHDPTKEDRELVYIGEAESFLKLMPLRVHFGSHFFFHVAPLVV